MELLGSVYTGLKSFYNGLNPATLSGAIDVIVVRQPDGSLRCTPFHVRFGKISLLRIKVRPITVAATLLFKNLHLAHAGDGGRH